MLKKLCLTLCVCLIPSVSALAAGKSDKADHPPRLELLKGEKKPLRKARKDVLTSLYTQLKIAKNAESAEVIVSAIDKLWTQSGSDTTDLLMQRAQVALQNRNYDLALKLLQAVSETDPRYTAGWSQLATVYYLKDRYSDAMYGLRRVLALDPQHFKAIEGLAIILREAGKKKAALAVFRKALEVHPYLESAKKAAEELEREVEGQAI